MVAKRRHDPDDEPFPTVGDDAVRAAIPTVRAGRLAVSVKQDDVEVDVFGATSDALVLRVVVPRAAFDAMRGSIGPVTRGTHAEEGSESQRANGPVSPVLSADEGKALFDAAARSLAGMSGDEWLRRYDAGEFDRLIDHPDHPEVVDLYMLLPFARQDI